MKLATLTCLTGVLAIGLGSGIAHAIQKGDPVDSEACKGAWSLASPNGETISKDKAVDYVINFSMVDSDADAKISADEFARGCEKGLVKADAWTAKDMQ